MLLLSCRRNGGAHSEVSDESELPERLRSRWCRTVPLEPALRMEHEESSTLGYPKVLEVAGHGLLCAIAMLEVLEVLDPSKL